MTCAVVFSEMEIGVSINGAHLAYWCAQFLGGRQEQQEVIRWLSKFMETSKWPTQTMIDRLKKCWAWEDLH